MQLPASTKTEHRAINALESIIDEHCTMEHQFNGNDKEMAWDGYIWLFKNNNGQQTKDNLDARVPVQIKGHNDSNRRYFGKDKITYPVKIVDLKAYSTEKGVLYFQIFLDRRNKAKIYYASLYPSKISDYLDRAEGKKNISSINVAFTRLDNSPEKLYIVAKQFSEEATKQGSAYNPLVKDRIRITDFEKLTSITLSVVGARDEYSALLRLSSGDVCLYGKTKEDKYSRPIEWNDDIKYIVGKNVKQSLGIGKETYYDSYRCIADSEGGMELLLSPNLKLNLSEGKFDFKICSSLRELYHDANFLLNLKSADSFNIQGHKFSFIDPVMGDDFENRLKYIIELYSVLTMIGFNTDILISDLSDDERMQLSKVVNMRLGAYNNQLKDDICRYDWKYDGKYVPLLVIKNVDKNILEPAIYTDKYAVFLPDNEGAEAEAGKNKVPLFICHNEQILSNLLIYDYEHFKRQIDDCDCNENTSNALLEGALRLINVYDANNDEHFLELAEYLLSKIELFIPEELFVLNMMQIKKRKTELTLEDEERLNRLDSDNMQVKFGKEVLMEKYDDAEKTFTQFSDDEKERYMMFPIYTLYNMKKKSFKSVE